MPLLDDHRALIMWIRTYVDAFRQGNRLHPMLQSKWAHSARVARLCGDLAAELGWPVPDRSAALTAGLLHDVGRFSQWTDYATYHDGSSVNHALRGHEVLMAHSPLAGGSPVRAAEILDAVRCHNMREVPSDLPESSRPLVSIVRDADKLDIYEVVHRYLQRGELGTLLPRLDPNGPVSPELVREIARTRHASYALARSVADFLLIAVSWVYDVNYVPTLRRVSRSGALDRLGAYLPGSAEAQRPLEAARAYVASRV